MFELSPFRRNNSIARKNDFMDFDGFFNNFFNMPAFSAFMGVNSMRADIKEVDKNYVIECEIPGANKEDIKLELKNGVLTVSYEQKNELNEEKDNYIRKERSYGLYSRSFNVGDISPEEVNAHYENGVLSIKIPKAESKGDSGNRIDIH